MKRWSLLSSSELPCLRASIKISSRWIVCLWHKYNYSGYSANTNTNTNLHPKFRASIKNSLRCKYAKIHCKFNTQIICPADFLDNLKWGAAFFLRAILTLDLQLRLLSTVLIWWIRKAMIEERNEDVGVATLKRERVSLKTEYLAAPHCCLYLSILCPYLSENRVFGGKTQLSRLAGVRIAGAPLWCIEVLRLAEFRSLKLDHAAVMAVEMMSSLCLIIGSLVNYC